MLGVMSWWYGTSILYLFGASTNFSSFTFLFPLCAVAPYSLCYLENKKNHMDYLILQRCSSRQYLNSLFVTTALSGFLVMVFGTALFLATLPLFFPNAVLSYAESSGIIWPYMEDIAQKELWISYFGMFAILLGIAGALWAVMALVISTWIDNLYAIFMMPILVLYMLDHLLTLIHFYPLSTLAFGAYFFESRTELFTYVLCAFVPLTGLCYILFIVKGRRQCRGCL